MMRHLLAASILALLSSTCFAAGEPPSSYLPLCAELDLAAVSDIELASATGQAPADKIAAAFFQVMQARDACASGRVSEALAIYDDIAFE
jgi:hypothetical protein